MEKRPAREAFRAALVDSEEAFLEQEADWKRLVELSEDASIFVSWEWVSIWWEVYGKSDSRSLHIIRVEDAADEVVGFAPLMVDTNVYRGVRTLGFIGQFVDTYSEFLDIISERRMRQPVARAVTGFLFEKDSGSWDLLQLEAMDSASATLSSFWPGVPWARLRYVPQELIDSPYVTIDGDWDSFLSSQSANFRSQYRRAFKRMKGLPERRECVPEEIEEVGLLLEEVIRLHRDRWGAASGSFRSDESLEFHRRLATRLYANDMLYLHVVCSGSKAIAARYDFIWREKLYCFQGGWNLDYSRFGPGNYMTGEAIKWAISRGLTEYDFLGGASEYKRRWSNGNRRMTSFKIAAQWRIRPALVILRDYLRQGRDGVNKSIRQIMANLRGRGD